jgi:hypothetical protein
MVMNNNTFEIMRKKVVVVQPELFQYLPEWTEETHEKPQSR